MRKITSLLLLTATMIFAGCANHEIHHYDCPNIGISYDGFENVNVKDNDGELYNVFWDDLGFLIQKIDYDDLDSNTNFMKILNDKTQQIAINKKINITNQNIENFETNSLTGIYTMGAGDGKGISWIFGVAEPSHEETGYLFFFTISYTKDTELTAKNVVLKSIELIKQ
ncbi:MAG: hypothetical protein IKQ46_14605 [Bacteroidales bacterium]|jgi:hypothetical protein|nr:hypothetical protein [Bacteroidales bacterium]